MARARAVEALSYMRIAVERDDLELASQWAMVYMVEDRATQVSVELREKYQAEHVDSQNG